MCGVVSPGPPERSEKFSYMRILEQNDPLKGIVHRCVKLTTWELERLLLVLELMAFMM